MSIESILAILFGIAALASFINHKAFRLPSNVGLTFVTLLMSLTAIGIQKIGDYGIDSHIQLFLESIEFDTALLKGMLGFMLFASSLHINVMELAKHKYVIGMLATISVIVSTALVGTTMWWCASQLGLDFPLPVWLVFGALISPTDPIAVLGILKSVKAPKQLETKIVGESLFNDGAGIVLFVLMMGIATGADENTLSSYAGFDLTHAAIYFIQQGVGGLVAGAVWGLIISILLKKIDSCRVATLMTLASVAGGFALAEHLFQVSPVIVTAVSGLVIGSRCRRGGMSQKTVDTLDEFWEVIDDVLNAVVFVLIGLEVVRVPFHAEALMLIALAIPVVLLARLLSVVLPIGASNLFRKFKPRVLATLTWGGLRGGISIALALTIPPGPMRDVIMTTTYGVVVFSIVVQGVTLGPLLNRLYPHDTKPQLARI